MLGFFTMVMRHTQPPAMAKSNTVISKPITGMSGRSNVKYKMKTASNVQSTARRTQMRRSKV